MDCEGVRARYIEALVGGQALAEEVAAHLSTCHGCRAEAESLASTWTALASFPLDEPGADMARRLQWRIRAEAAREALVSLGRWQQAALAGVAIPARGAAVPGVLGLLEAPVVFLIALVPYVLSRCGDFPLALLVGFIAGIAAGAIAGGGAGTWLGHRHAWV